MSKKEIGKWNKKCSVVVNKEEIGILLLLDDLYQNNKSRFIQSSSDYCNIIF